MSELHLQDVSFAWDNSPLLDEIEVRIEKGERIGLLGRNGSGKSTFMKILAGEIEPDHGSVRRRFGLRVARLIQEVPTGDERTVRQLVASGCEAVDDATTDAAADARSVKRVLTRMDLDGEADFKSLSSGMKRRVLLAQAIVADPDVLLLDEPTNHLDVEAISWLERFLKGFAATLVFVTHDRVFLESLATRILEIDRGKIFDWSCDYATFLKRKDAALEAEAKQQSQFDKVLAREEAWIRQGIKARRTRNEGRVRSLKKLREEYRQRRERVGKVRMQAVESERSGEKVIETQQLSFSYGEKTIVRDLSMLIERRDKVGLIGPNGSGKSTLLKLLLGQLSPSAGTVKHGTKLQILYFDQLREQIDPDKSVIENVGEGQENLLIHGKQKHIYGYLQDFLFTPERARQPAKLLSGGERNRLLLARLFKRPSNLLVLDEPTNDLDLETLELLEELVLDYSGTLLLVSHDRAFLNHVVTSTLVFEGDGRVAEYAGGYDDYIRQRDQRSNATDLPTQVSSTPPRSRKNPMPSGGAKLTFKEQRDLDSLPATIESLESQLAQLHDQMADPDFYRQSGSLIAETKAMLASVESELQRAYALWEDLESRA